MTPLNDLSVRLRDADPVPREPGLPSDAIAAMRQAIVAATPAAPGPSLTFANAFAMAAFAVLTIVLSMVGLRRADTVGGGGKASPSGPPAVGYDGRTQLLFSTPGGTRIIWTIDPGFQLKEARQ